MARIKKTETTPVTIELTETVAELLTDSVKGRKKAEVLSGNAERSRISNTLPANLAFLQKEDRMVTFIARNDKDKLEQFKVKAKDYLFGGSNSVLSICKPFLYEYNEESESWQLAKEEDVAKVESLGLDSLNIAFSQNFVEKKKALNTSEQGRSVLPLAKQTDFYFVLRYLTYDKFVSIFRKYFSKELDQYEQEDFEIITRKMYNKRKLLNIFGIYTLTVDDILHVPFIDENGNIAQIKDEAHLKTFCSPELAKLLGI